MPPELEDAVVFYDRLYRSGRGIEALGPELVAATAPPALAGRPANGLLGRASTGSALLQACENAFSAKSCSLGNGGVEVARRPSDFIERERAALAMVLANLR